MRLARTLLIAVALAGAVSAARAGTMFFFFVGSGGSGGGGGGGCAGTIDLSTGCIQPMLGGM